MRLICPNCDAEYEVDDAAIPREGRDVQCSACGHAWFQTHPEAEAEAEAEAALYEAPEGAVAPAQQDDDGQDDADAGAPEQDVPEAAAADEAGAEEVSVGMPSAAARGLDASMLAVLKEEAEREAAARRAEAQGRPVLESQTEMPLPAAAAGSSMAAAVKRIAKLRGVAVDEADRGAAEAPAAEPDGDGSGEGEAAARPRRKSFPAIEEINQSLRSSGNRGQDPDDAVAETLAAQAGEARQKARGGFRRGFLTLVVLAALVVALYHAAPLVSARVPALEGAMTGYVETVDQARIVVDAQLQGLIGWLRGLTGSAAG